MSRSPCQPCLSTHDCFRQADKQFSSANCKHQLRLPGRESSTQSNLRWQAAEEKHLLYIVRGLNIKCVSPATILYGVTFLLMGYHSAHSETDKLEAGMQPSWGPRYSIRRIDQELVSWWPSIIIGTRLLCSHSLWIAVLQKIQALLAMQMRHKSLWQTV